MKSQKLSRSQFNSKLLAYSATAGAALMVAPQAHATIHNITEFKINHGSYGTTPPSVGIGHVSFTGATPGLIVGLNRGRFNVAFASGPSHRYNVDMQMAGTVSGHIAGTGLLISNLGFGVRIAGKSFAGENIGLADRSKQTFSGDVFYVHDGNFDPNGANAHDTGYIGFKTDLRGHTYYGWLRVEVSNNGNGNPAAVTLVSKNGNPGVYGAFGLASDNITTGEIAPVPEPSGMVIGGLGLLALGARGVKELRRRRQATKAG
jgi:hypothetical protein